MTDRKSITSATTEDSVPEPPSLITSAALPPGPTYKHSGQWVMPPAAPKMCVPPTAPYAVLPDGREEPLTNCPSCDELGFARFAHYHVCPPVIPKDDGVPLSMGEVRERIGANLRHYFEKHPDEVEGIRATPEYERHVEQLRARARKLPEEHWGHSRPHIYIEVLSNAYVWAKLVE